MKLLSFLHERRRRIGVVDGDIIHVVSWTGDMLDLIRRGLTPTIGAERLSFDEIDFEPPLRPPKILAIGKNYAEHAQEMKSEAPEKPLIFAKMPTALLPHNGIITWRQSITQQVDWEGELAVVIGKRAREVNEADALNYVYGYTIANDITARDIQASESQWIRAKGLDTFAPMGPYLITSDEIPNPNALAITTEVNGEVMQDGHTSNMIHSVPALIAYLSQSFTLEPGDVILTGTPAGVGKGKNPPRFLQDGDEVRVTISQIGTLSNSCRRLD